MEDLVCRYLDLCSKSLGYLLPLNLLCCGDEPSLGRPLVWGKDDSTEEFDRFEAALLARGITTLENEGLRFGQFAEFVKRCLRSAESDAEVHLVWHNDRDRLLGIGLGVRADVADEVAGPVGGFKALNRDVLAALELDEVLHTVEFGVSNGLYRSRATVLTGQ